MTLKEKIKEETVVETSDYKGEVGVWRSDVNGRLRLRAKIYRVKTVGRWPLRGEREITVSSWTSSYHSDDDYVETLERVQEQAVQFQKELDKETADN